jgi:site-specific recombinase XerD
MAEPAVLHFPKLGLPLDDLVERFLQELKNANRSRYTITNYRADLGRFVRHVGTQMPIENLSRQAVQNYLSTLEEKAPTTRARHQAAIRAFLKWCHAQGHIQRDPAQHLPSIRVPQPYPRAMDDATIQRVLKVIPSDNLRDRLLFTLVAETGLRIGEALDIYREDVNLTPDDEKIAIRGKGQTTRTVMLYAAPDSLALLRRYLSASRIASGPLFRGHWRRRGTAKPMHYRTAHSVWKSYCLEAGVEADIHALRHSYATALVNNGVRLEVVRKLLGHKSMQTTLRYAEVNDATVKAELRDRMRTRRFE